MELRNFQFQILCSSEKETNEKNYSNDTVYVCICKSARKAVDDELLSFSLWSWDWAECWISLHARMRKELKASSLKYFVAKRDYWSDFISYALLIRCYYFCCCSMRVSLRYFFASFLFAVFTTFWSLSYRKQTRWQFTVPSISCRCWIFFPLFSLLCLYFIISCSINSVILWHTWISNCDIWVRILKSLTWVDNSHSDFIHRFCGIVNILNLNLNLNVVNDDRKSQREHRSIAKR